MLKNNPIMRVYKKRIIYLTIGYLLSVGASSILIPDDATFSLLYFGISLIPGIFVIGWIWAMGRLMLDLDDEYIRMLEVRKMLLATGFVMGVTSIWGLVEMSLAVPRLPVFYVFPLWCLGLVIAEIINRMTFGDKGNCA